MGNEARRGVSDDVPATDGGPLAPAFYAAVGGGRGWRAWLTLLHLPYTAWHLSYVAIGAALAPQFTGWRLAGALLAFFLAVGVGAHALDELRGRPLGTDIPASVLLGAAAIGVVVPVAAGLAYGGWRMLPFVGVGIVLVVAYNLELGRGLLHNGFGFALGWGAFPVLTGYYAQTFQLGLSALVAAGAAFLLSLAQRTLSLRARDLRRRTASVSGHAVGVDGRVSALDRQTLLAPVEDALRLVAAGLVCLAVAMVLSR